MQLARAAAVREADQLTATDIAVKKIAARECGLIAVIVNYNEMSDEDKERYHGLAMYFTTRQAANPSRKPFTDPPQSN